MLRMYRINLFDMVFRFRAQSPRLAVGFASGDSSMGDRARLFGSGLNVSEQEVTDAVTKLVTLLASVFNIGVYEEVSGQ